MYQPGVTTLLIRALDGTVSDYYPLQLPRHGEAVMGGRRFADRVEWARVGGHIEVETQGIMVVQLDVTRSWDEATRMLPILGGRVGR